MYETFDYESPYDNTHSAITARVPELIRDLIGKNKCGPNCFNATIIYFDPDYPIVFVDGDRFLAWIEENTVPVSGPLPIEGIRVYRCNRCGAVLHTAVQVGPEIFFHKVGIYYHIGWEYADLQRVDGIYLDLECSECFAASTRIENQIFKDRV